MPTKIYPAMMARGPSAWAPDAPHTRAATLHLVVAADDEFSEVTVQAELKVDVVLVKDLALVRREHLKVAVRRRRRHEEQQGGDRQAAAHPAHVSVAGDGPKRGA